MDKGKIIQMAFLRLGKNNEYNDNKSDEYKTATLLCDHIVGQLAKETAFLFNSVTVTLTQYQPSTNVLGENRFNKPADLLNIIRADVMIREEGEFIYSNEKEVQLQYCKKIDIVNMPDNLTDLVIYGLCIQLCLAYNSWIERISYFEQKYAEEKAKILANQFNNFKFGG